MRRILLSTAASAILCLAGATPATAQTTTLRDALVEAYKTNPTITAQRATQRANDENVPIARAAGLPGVTSGGGYSENLYDTAGGAGPLRSATARVDLSVPVYTGGAVRGSVRAAETRVEAGRATLRGTEADVFTQVVAAYNDVIRDEAIVRLNQLNVRVLQTNLQAARDRFEVGDLTRTDVAQSEARYSLAEGQLRSAEATLVGSRETYVRVVGSPPGALSPPPTLPNLPTDPQSAVQVAMANNPDLDAASKQRDATRYDIAVAKSQRLPRVSVSVGSAYQNYLGSVGNQAALAGFRNDSLGLTGGVNLSLPLFQGGRPAAQVRQAEARRSAAIEQVTDTERFVIARTRSAYANWQSSLQVIRSSEIAVDANKLSLEGVRAENSVGTRTILDILNAEQELLNSQVTLVSARRNAYVAGFALLAAMGKAEARDLNLDGGPLYDPVVNYDRVRRRISDFGSDGEPAPVATRTSDTAAQTPAVTVDPALADPALQRPAATMPAQRPVDTRPSNPAGVRR
ncbi:TolC family outer membrane protein [Sphingomonas donggukensis]|uniref:TolC family outer membrane protein n=2 Tax=Sphingomonas donggukensis TaxID=2949093 RepID=A0ABY4TW91_9SPHN|nr:TolC family outer membrane protein [Sphingomonas donggukensis]URW76680.1 TolC family outer membrane protein [Sphingomonas donggukensis]